MPYPRVTNSGLVLSYMCVCVCMCVCMCVYGCGRCICVGVGVGVGMCMCIGLNNVYVEREVLIRRCNKQT
jgi:hypothetical protein